jgi:hypothetical protein
MADNQCKECCTLDSALLNQGDQIGRIFAYWVIVYFWQFFENFRSSHILGLLFPWYKL